MSRNGKQVRVGVDIGGTFTDIVLEIEHHQHSTKVLTSYANPEQAIIDGILQVADTAKVELSDIDVIIHGTTLATNALIERKGAHTAFITTKGFRDVIEMRTENRFEQYDLDIVLPPPLVERNHRHVLDERVGADGQVYKSPSSQDVAELADRIVASAYESVAIGFMHSYLNGAHEKKMRDALLSRAPHLSISISSEVSPQMREFQRFNTVCANAYVKPLMASYLNRLVNRLRQEGTVCPVFMMHSGGGIISVESAAEFPVRLLESGPAGGAIFAAHVAAGHGLDAVLSYDMGGTTAKICLIEKQVPKTAKTFEVARTYRFKKGSGMPISIPVIEMVEIGAGGGSIASVDTMRQIRVGPHSSGSEPGPACYARGGDKPTVTDADLLLGKLDPEEFAGGDIRLSTSAAQVSIQSALGEKLGIDETTASFGLCEIVDENMSNAARMHAVENGKELSGFTMIAFGGAAPLHAGRLCDKLGIDQFLVPPGAGVGSAIGFLRAPFGFESVRSAYLRLSRFDAQKVNTILEELAEEATSFVHAGAPGTEPSLECVAYMRYVGQGWEIPVAIDIRAYRPDEGSVFRRCFDETYEGFFDRLIDGLDVEIVSWSLRASSSVPPAETVAKVKTGREMHGSGTRKLFDSSEGAFTDARIVARSALQPGDLVKGPAIVTERETTTIIATGREAILQADGCLLVRLKRA